ncbi:hypothetical protein A8L34_11730 [Bacillus sp. FJAT-27264]|nr:hypothetical protein A8L34_11730 [Bacillus sp. FJAT-27264]
MTRFVVDGSKQFRAFMLAMSQDFTLLSLRKPVVDMPTEFSVNLRGGLKMQIYFEAAEANYNK